MTTATVGLDAFERESNVTTPHRLVRGTGDLPQITKHTTQWPLHPVLTQVS